jgi:hypothetical protein
VQQGEVEPGLRRCGLQTRSFARFGAVFQTLERSLGSTEPRRDGAEELQHGPLHARMLDHLPSPELSQVARLAVALLEVTPEHLPCLIGRW